MKSRSSKRRRRSSTQVLAFFSFGHGVFGRPLARGSVVCPLDPSFLTDLTVGNSRKFEIILGTLLLLLL
jgi:hypothetical protein